MRLALERTIRRSLCNSRQLTPFLRIRSTGGLQALAVSTVGIMGACRVWPKFNRALSVSSKTALIATPFFGTFVLLSELELNACARRARDARLLLSQQKREDHMGQMGHMGPCGQQ